MKILCTMTVPLAEGGTAIIGRVAHLEALPAEGDHVELTPGLFATPTGRPVWTLGELAGWPKVVLAPLAPLTTEDVSRLRAAGWAERFIP